MHLAQLSSNPSRKKAYLSPFALASQLTDEATALEEEDIPLINPLEGLSQLAKAIARCRYFGSPASKFISARLARMVCSEDTRIYIGSGGISLHLVCCCSCYQHLVCSRGCKRMREKFPSFRWKD